MMTLDEAISHAEEIAELNEDGAKAWTRDGWQSAFKNLTPEKETELKANRVILADECAKCAEEHRQLAEWLKELKALREQRPQGEWIKHKNGDFHCTNCGFEIDTYIAAVFFNFCPNCGADMRVKDELNRVSKELNKELNSENEKSKSEIIPDYRDGWRLKEGEAE